MAGDEEEIRRGWLAAAREWARQTAPRVLAPYRSAGLPPDAVWVLSTQGVWVEALNANVRPPILATLRGAVGRFLGRPPEPSFDQAQYTREYLDQAINRMVNTPDQVYREIAAQLADGVAEGESIPELASRVQAVFEVTGNPWWENRATVVARTEVHAAVQAGTLAGAAQQQIDTGKQLLKRWEATVSQPGRTRPAHLAAHGQTVPLMAPFIVDNERLQYPGDPNGSAANVIQCRCALTFREA